nr:hypothetical protein [Tanacetum cinerariifolium]
PPPPPLLTTEPTTTTTRPPDVARSHGGDGGGEDRPLHTMYPAVAWVALLTEPSPHPGRAESTAVSTSESTADRRCQQMLSGPTTVTVEVRIAPL